MVVFWASPGIKTDEPVLPHGLIPAEWLSHNFYMWRADLEVIEQRLCSPGPLLGIEAAISAVNERN